LSHALSRYNPPQTSKYHPIPAANKAHKRYPIPAAKAHKHYPIPAANKAHKRHPIPAGVPETHLHPIVTALVPRLHKLTATHLAAVGTAVVRLSAQHGADAASAATPHFERVSLSHMQNPGSGFGLDTLASFAHVMAEAAAAGGGGGYGGLADGDGSVVEGRQVGSGAVDGRAGRGVAAAAGEGDLAAAAAAAAAEAAAATAAATRNAGSSAAASYPSEQWLSIFVHRLRALLGLGVGPRHPAEAAQLPVGGAASAPAAADGGGGAAAPVISPAALAQLCSAAAAFSLANVSCAVVYVVRDVEVVFRLWIFV